jgi:hypothetical protein
VHGRAGALLAAEIGESGALATDIVDALPRALREILAGARSAAAPRPTAATRPTSVRKAKRR